MSKLTTQELHDMEAQAARFEKVMILSNMQSILVINLFGVL